MAIFNPNTVSNSADGPLSLRRAVSIAAGLFCGVTLTLHCVQPSHGPASVLRRVDLGHAPGEGNAGFYSRPEEFRTGIRSVSPPGMDASFKEKKLPTAKPSTCTT